MINKMKRQALKQDVKFQVVPIECLLNIKADIEEFKNTNRLNQFQEWITDKRYILEIPELDFKPESIVISAVKFDLIKAEFCYKNKQVSDILDISRKGSTELFSEIFKTNNYSLKYVHWLPQKRLAVRSGLTEYGRNNITYDSEWGSFIELSTYFSDLPVKEFNWDDVKMMDICNKCGLCLSNCPTGAILPERFLIDNEICLTRQNEFGTKPFPEWIPVTAHHRLTGCLRCQDICPANQEVLANINKSIEFTEEETAHLLAGTEKENMPQSMIEKAERNNIDLFFPSLARNLAAMFANINLRE